MPQPKRSQQGSPEELPVLRRLLDYKRMLRKIQDALYDVDIEDLSIKDIDYYRKDLNLLLKDIKILKDNQKSSPYFRSTAALLINIQDAVTELAVARNLLLAIKQRELKMAEIADGVRQFHRSLISCENYLEEAQKQFTI